LWLHFLARVAPRSARRAAHGRSLPPGITQESTLPRCRAPRRAGGGAAAAGLWLHFLARVAPRSARRAAHGRSLQPGVTQESTLPRCRAPRRASGAPDGTPTVFLRFALP
jgi:hypothetical protein